MGWKDLLQPATEETLVSPWVGGRSLRLSERTWTIDGRLPPEHGWSTFLLNGRRAKFISLTEPETDKLQYRICGYLVGDRFVADDVRVDPDPMKIIGYSEQIHLVEQGLDRFVRVASGRMFEGGPLVFQGQEMPLGPEEDVLKAYLDQTQNVNNIKNVSPALDAAFRMESWRRAEAERRRIELDRLRREEAERLAREERRRQLVEQLGDGSGRRAMAQVDFGQAARAALTVGGAEYLDHRRAYRGGEMTVRFRLNRRRFECTCDERTLRIIDAGICLTAEYDQDGFDQGTRGDTFFTLESLPGVITQAVREGNLVVFRHVD